MSNPLQEIIDIAGDLRPGRLAILHDIAESLSLDVEQEINPSSGFVSADFGDAFAARLLVHHATTASPMKKKRFEYALLQTMEALDRDAVLTRSSTNPGEDIRIGGTTFSLKTEASSNINPEKITISKFQEARWIRECESPEDCAEGVRQHVGRHLDQYERILMLRVFKPSAFDSLFEEVRYDLVEIPVDLLAKSLELPPDAFSEPNQKTNSSGASVRDDTGRQLFYLTLDGSVEKVTIRSLLVDECTLHGSWVVPLSA